MFNKRKVALGAFSVALALATIMCVVELVKGE